MINRQFKNIFRFLRKNALFTTINVLGLAFGFTCAILIFLHVLKEKNYNTAFPEHERIFSLVQKNPDSPLGNTSISYALTPLLKDRYPEIEYATRTENHSWFSNCIFTYQSTEGGDLKAFNESSFFLADEDLFEIFQFPFIEGNAKEALQDPYSLVLSKSTAEKYFGNKTALGKSLVLNNEKTFTVTGVVEVPSYVSFSFNMLAPFKSVRSDSKLAGWDNNGQPYFKLHKGIDYKEFNKKIENFYSELRPEQVRNPEQLTLTMFPIKERHLYYNKNALHLIVFLGIVLLVVCILNYINMSTSLIQKRTSEIAMKKISGASRSIVGFQFMWETALICFVAVVLGVFLAIIGMPVFRTLVGSNVRPYFINNIDMFVLGSLILWIVVTLLSGFYPSMVLSGLKPLVLFNKNGKSGSRMLSKNILITFQFAISIVLVILTFMINRQYRYMQNIPLGFDNNMVMQIPFTNELKDEYTNLKFELKKIPTIKDVCAASSMPVGIPNHSGITWVDDQQEKHEESFAFAIVSEGYTQTFDMKMVMGNEFTDEKPEDQKGVILNEEAAQRLEIENPIGKSLHFWGKENPIIGVVKDFQNNYLFNQVKPMVISAHPENQGFTKFLFVSIMPRNVSGTVGEIEKLMKQISPEFPFEYSFTSRDVENYINEIKEVNNTFRFASIVSILLAVIGLVALTYHATQARIKEIGIRKVNGARIPEIINLLNGVFMRSVLIAFFVAAPIAWIIISNLLQGFGNRTNIAWWVFALAGIVVGVIALATVSWQSWRAAVRNPLEALRYE